MLLRTLKKVLHRFSTKQKEAGSSAKAALPSQYLVFPTKFPIFPYYVYTTQINRFLYHYITKNNIKYVVAFPIQPGIFKKSFHPASWDDLVKECKQSVIQVKLKSFATKDQKQNHETPQTFELMNNNLTFDASTSSTEQPGIQYIDRIGQIFPIGSLCKIVTQHENSKYTAYLRSELRFQINPYQYSEAQGPIMYLSGNTLKNTSILNIGNDHSALLEVYNRILNISNINLPDVRNSSITKLIELLGGYLCTITYFTPLQLYSLFQTINMADRTKILIQYYTQYAKVLQEQWKYYNQQSSQKTDEKSQKKIVEEIYANLQRIMGFRTDMEYINGIKKKLESGRYPETIAKIIECQLSNIQELGDGNPEIHKKKYYLNLLVNYPFGMKAKEQFDLPKARQILDEDHYGMKKVKQRILEFIAVSKIKGEFKSKVLLLHGPPGVGKTSIVKSIAKCLNRPYGRISLGGEYDTSIMKGHRKTYIGAYPGKIYDTIFKSKVENPVILLDEIDKIQERSGGANLQDVIMEILDPVQNHKFKDDFMDVQIDLSKVLFICTANELETIFPPLLDRLERIEMSGYTTSQKKQIFSQYILKQSMENAGLPAEIQEKLNFTDQGLHGMIEGYCKEAGMRNLVRKTNKIFNKIALEYVQNKPFDHQIAQSSLKKYLGLPQFRQARLFYKIPPKGVMIGLAYNAYGGSIMYIEAAASNIRNLPEKTQTSEAPKGSLMLTGNIHDVMKESCQLAYTYAKYITSTFFDNHYLEINDVHLNFPQIQIGKDGPSAGAAITCTLVSLALDKNAHKQIAMTGQISLSGKISAIGGVKQKTMGAKREGIQELIFPQQNRPDVEQLESQIKEGIKFHFASHFFEVMQLIFGLKISDGTD